MDLISEDVQITPLTVKALEKLQLELTTKELEDALVRANYDVPEGEWSISDFKFVTVKLIRGVTHAIYDIVLEGKSWSRSDTVQLPFQADTGNLVTT